MPRWKDRRRAQAGTTLIELLVSLVIVGLALTLIVGTFSTGLIQATMAKRNTTAQAVLQYELENISGAQFQPFPQGYSDCFAPNSLKPDPAPIGTCPDGLYEFRADMNVGAGPTLTVQSWTVTVISLPDTPIGSPMTVFKSNR